MFVGKNALKSTLTSDLNRTCDLTVLHRSQPFHGPVRVKIIIIWSMYIIYIYTCIDPISANFSLKPCKSGPDSAVWKVHTHILTLLSPRASGAFRFHRAQLWRPLGSRGKYTCYLRTLSRDGGQGELLNAQEGLTRIPIDRRAASAVSDQKSCP